ncbi:hypothetical protein Tco_0715211 [Tanacetum coccineum]
MEYLVKISKKARIMELKRRHLKISVLTSYTMYPSRKIRHICACTSQETTKIQRPIRRLRKKYRLSLKNDMPPRDKLEEEKARRHDKVYNWETVTYGRIWDDDEVHNLRSVETKFLENDNDKVNMPSFPSPEPTVSYFDDLDYLKFFENEFPVIVYNDALTSKSDFLTESTMCP